EEKVEEALNLIRVDAREHLKDSIILKELEVSIYIEMKKYDEAISIVLLRSPKPFAPSKAEPGV
ncbi:hypothetical protein ACFL6K_06915, partial [Candidatus Latescibacterota bacterium]